ncbi:exodeoxyribonuclease V subunit alpha [Desulfobacter hydrogenophilus]|uniref:Exodeoxyribonuclease V subunit alpha n=2 Tax=Desulfobacter hydrogenophilus TaxID=2291 RepID=A0A328FDF1_9BACT|nr:exodeoxyribonuclease V subunit alpha [Desulfobacter hydrogenophilus]QBH15582.1 exodeoxyribonuclease V subunit alpha [Desulfobacter hydrogenophilus]RAM01123.1 exodeoxyribonuclease V subunit alpha [Desulfobacter hydrogenophilus]
MPLADFFDLLQTWTVQGWLRQIDKAFVIFLNRQDPSASSMVLLGAALASHQLGRGHICLDMASALADPDGTLSLPPEGETGEDMPAKPSQLLCNLTKKLWVEQLSNSNLVSEDTGSSPLVLQQGRLYLRRYWQYTLQVAREILGRVGQTAPVPQDLERRLDKLFSNLRSPEETKKQTIHWQSVAAAVVVASNFSVISGGPGTGKTTTVVQVIALLQGISIEQGKTLRIRLAAPTGKAAARLTESISRAIDFLPEKIQAHMPTEVTTLHRLLGTRHNSRHFIHNRTNQLHLDFLVVDEASMVDLEMMDALLSALPSQARLILLGDKDQLASVEAGFVLGDICANASNPCYQSESVNFFKKATGYDLSEFSGPGTGLDQQIVVLRKSHRFHENSGIGNLARAVNQGDGRQVSKIWEKGYPDISKLVLLSCEDEGFRSLILDGNLKSFPHAVEQPAGYREYLEVITRGHGDWPSEEHWFMAVLESFNRFQLLSPIRKGDWGVEGLNRICARILYKAGLIQSTQGWYPGRPVMVTRNDYSLGLMNGDIGIVLEVGHDGQRNHEKRGGAKKVLRVVFPMADGSIKQMLPSRLGAVETVYAMTVHKSQGSEFDHTALVLPDAMSPVLTRELLYTGITRARSFFTLAGTSTDILAEAVEQRTHRASGLGNLLLKSDG